MRNKQGYTLVEMLIGLFYVSMVLLLVVMIASLLVKKSENIEHFSQNKIGLIQLQNELTLGHSYTFDDDGFCYEKFEVNFCLKFDQNRLVKTPGYEIFLVNITGGTFFLNGDELTVQFNEKRGIVNEKLKLIP